MKQVKPSKSHTRTGLRATLLEMASRPQGCCAADLNSTWTLRQIGNNACGLAAEGKLILVGIQKLRRYFTDQASAAEYEQQLPAMREARKQAYKERERAENAKRMARRRASQPKPHQAPHVARKQEAEPAPVSFKAPKVKWSDMAPKTTSDTKVSIEKSPPAFGPAARLLNVKPAQLANDLPPLKVGSRVA